MKFLKEDTKLSTTRLALFIGMMIAVLIGASMSFNIVYNTIKCAMISWTGQASMLTALTAFVGSLVWGKVNQKKHETNTNISKEELLNTITNNTSSSDDVDEELPENIKHFNELRNNSGQH